jgi:hypothetical protein
VFFKTPCERGNRGKGKKGLKKRKLPEPTVRKFSQKRRLERGENSWEGFETAFFRAKKNGETI